MTRANLLLIRELNVNGDGDFADVMIQLERPLTPEQKRALRVELTRLKQVLDDPDTDSGCGTCYPQYFRFCRCAKRL